MINKISILSAGEFFGKTFGKAVWLLDYIVGLFMFIALINVIFGFYFDKPNKVYSLFWFLGALLLSSFYYILR